MRTSVSIEKICFTFEISRQSYYQHEKRVIRERYQEEIVLQLVYSKRKRLAKLGGRKLYHALKIEFERLGFRLGRDKFFNILRDNNLLVEYRKKYVITTNSHHRFRIYTNLIKELVITRPGEVIVGDITYIYTEEGFMYLALLTDVYCRKIIGYDISDNLSVEGSIRALKMALKAIGNVQDTIHHSDRGIQYCCYEYVNILTDNKLKISMAEKGNPYENAIAERVNGILKIEFLLDQRFSTKVEAKYSSIEAINIYNEERPHLSLGYMTPEEKYQEYKQNSLTGILKEYELTSVGLCPPFVSSYSKRSRDQKV